jgi:hypothetical protein
MLKFNLAKEFKQIYFRIEWIICTCRYKREALAIRLISYKDEGMKNGAGGDG